MATKDRGVFVGVGSGSNQRLSDRKILRALGDRRLGGRGSSLLNLILEYGGTSDQAMLAMKWLVRNGWVVDRAMDLARFSGVWPRCVWVC